MLRDCSDGHAREVWSRVIVNASGPWVDDVQSSLSGVEAPSRQKNGRLRLVQGSHIVVPRLCNGNDAFILQNQDGRVVFVLPYEDDFSLVGTTDIDFSGEPNAAKASIDEITYLLDAVGYFFQKQPQAKDVVWSFAGVRPLYDDARSEASKVTRDYHLELAMLGDGSPILSILGGKITTYRTLAEDALSKIASFFPNMGQPWTDAAKLPGGDWAGSDFSAFVTDLVKRRPGLEADYLQRLARRHGSNVEKILGGANQTDDLGCHIGHDLYEREVAFLKQYEWARTPEDVLWRRTKTGLHLSPEETARAHEILRAML